MIMSSKLIETQRFWPCMNIARLTVRLPVCPFCYHVGPAKPTFPTLQTIIKFVNYGTLKRTLYYLFLQNVFSNLQNIAWQIICVLLF